MIDSAQLRLIRELTSLAGYSSTRTVSCPVVKIAVSGRLIQDERCERACIKHRGHPVHAYLAEPAGARINSVEDTDEKRRDRWQYIENAFSIIHSCANPTNGIRLGSIGSRVSLVDTKKSIFTRCIHLFFLSIIWSVSISLDHIPSIYCAIVSINWDCCLYFRTKCSLSFNYCLMIFRSSLDLVC